MTDRQGLADRVSHDSLLAASRARR